MSFKSTPPSSSQLVFFLVFGQDRIPTLLLSPKAAQLVARPDLLVEHNTGKLQGLVQNVYDILVVLLVEEYFSRSTIHDQAFFFFVFLKKIHSHSPCQFVQGPPARRQDPKSTLVALTAAPLILPFFQVQDKTSRDSSFVFATCKVCCKLELRRYLSSSTAGRAQCQASRGRSLQYKDRTTSRAL